ncbi:hypothetical protein [Flavobacterium sp. CECT 9288]|uniref:hypothetical protein n=1 Tax=Flavobacterium sp. CECT 9288 TaxID=2845819 RepID=UPI001E5EC697|nr:hypothetical protein [Flavobacterium sp. CECT 9288]
MNTTASPSTAFEGLILATVGALSSSLIVPVAVSVVDPTVPVVLVIATVKVSV